jgi:fatty acid amide hydrolase 2
MTYDKYKILYMSALDLAKEIKQGNITCSYVIDIFIQNIKQINPKINALAYDCFEEARIIAKQYDTRYIQKKKLKILDDLPIFYGVPLIIKESFEMEKKPLTFGLISRKNIKGRYTCDICKQLISNGIIILGAGNLSEGCYWIESINPIYGITSNPYDLNRTSGGSSGGTASLIAISGSPLGLASDSCGSIRLPAFYNGIFGHKPTAGLIPAYSKNKKNEKLKEGDYFYSQAGPMCKYASDLLPLLNSMTNPNKFETKQLININNISYKDIKIIYVDDSYDNKFVNTIDPDIKESIESILDYFQSEGSIIEKKTYHTLGSALYIWSRFINLDGTLNDFIIKENTNFKQNFINYFTGNMTTTTFGINILSDFTTDISISEKEEEFLRELKESLKKTIIKDLNSEKKYTVLISSSFPTVAPYHNKSYKYVFDIGILGIFNILGFPVTQVPLGLNKDGIPLGMQIIGLHYMDQLTIKIAELLEKSNKAKWIPPDIL